MAGGLPLHTPFGRIFSTNITPDPESGIGRWSREAFLRSMREGVDREGRHLYPVFPYTHFAKVSEQDLTALYAYLMSLKPVKAQRQSAQLSFPFDQRWLLAAWKILFHTQKSFTPDPSKSAAWNEGAYLVEGLGHCGACHSPRNALGGEVGGMALAGGEVDGMNAPAIGGRAQPVMPWTSSAMVDYLIDGRHAHHGIAAGPMTPVVDQLAQVPEEMVRAMAVYLTDGRDKVENEATILAAATRLEFRKDAPASPSASALTPSQAKGEAVFARACANCHRAGSANTPLALTSSVTGPDPRNLILLTLNGIRPPQGSPDKSMPKFSSLSDEDLTHLTLYIRGRFAPQARDGDVAAMVKALRAAP
ncbi:MAG: Aerobic-type carbon monoxide dehydrogenase, large subunit [Pseudomonadota bacterium]